MSRLKVKHSNPEGLFDSRVFSQVVTVSGNAKTIYIGGQNAINSEGQLIGRDNLELQTKQVLKNIQTALAAEDATFNDVIKLNIYMVNGCDPAVGLKAFMESIGELEKPPLITVLKVAGLANPLCLIEIDAIAVVEEKGDCLGW
ncbi:MULTISPECIES: RidA family protein [Acetivibrio]|uniref:RidA family protein n=1 Tax=Acetivibrio mesophilus TaxID=2487273 RepID=A0A4Q0I7J5_9FIRM|nr:MULTISPECIES: RidA family protein [Acetivibrio]ODM26512.1 enamine deaminase RidA [Clostridium sp. Bc-iso-3]RXE60386.1 RidA family protein [Acetivibrio mesophilus]